MSTTFDIGPAPAEENCAQIGHTTDFAKINILEVEAYQAALIARHGPPPEGCRFVRVTERHDFGTYRSLAIRVDDEADEDPLVVAYVNAVEDGLGTWISSGFSAPVTYVGSEPDGQPIRTLREIIIGALLTCRPNDDGTFAIPDFAHLHGNLSQAYPDLAEEARLRLPPIAA